MIVDVVNGSDALLTRLWDRVPYGIQTPEYRSGFSRWRTLLPIYKKVLQDIQSRRHRFVKAFLSPVWRKPEKDLLVARLLPRTSHVWYTRMPQRRLRTEIVPGVVTDFDPTDVESLPSEGFVCIRSTWKPACISRANRWLLLDERVMS